MLHTDTTDKRKSGQGTISMVMRAFESSFLSFIIVLQRYYS